MKIGDGSKKIFQTVMGSWHEGISQTSKMGEKQDDEETWGLEGEFLLDRGISRHIIHFEGLGESHRPNKKKLFLWKAPFSPPLCKETYVRTLAILIPVYVCKFLMRSHEGEVEHPCTNSGIDTLVEKLDSRNKKK